ncbi:HpcH/HpaI aldolase/citrate lyase family protein [Ensifer soli]|uniref:HpcH/HpaI aldolase/citrate lyase family protein n=1 Tax=Ciceribacter sp. sgz301302 TaxID=3342379 RepID=UPI0035B7702B
MSRIFDHHPQRLRRSVLSVPAINPRALAKAPGLSCDAVIYDLEDSVAIEGKREARAALAAHFASTPKGPQERIIRINEMGSEAAAADLALMAECRPDAVLLPKVESPGTVQAAADWLAENDLGDTLRLWAMIETPRGVLNAGAIAEAGRTFGGGLDCLVVGLNDLRKETRVRPLPGRTYLVPWLMQVLLAARGSGLDAIDAVFNAHTDKDGFEADCRQGAEMGFDGKMLIHPDQIAPANRHFGVDPQRLAEAQAIVSAFALPENAGKAVIDLAGRMVERLHLEEATATAARAAMAARKDMP